MTGLLASAPAPPLESGFLAEDLPLPWMTEPRMRLIFPPTLLLPHRAVAFARASTQQHHQICTWSTVIHPLIPFSSKHLLKTWFGRPRAALRAVVENQADTRTEDPGCLLRGFAQLPTPLLPPCRGWARHVLRCPHGCDSRPKMMPSAWLAVALSAQNEGDRQVRRFSVQHRGHPTQVSLSLPRFLRSGSCAHSTSLCFPTDPCRLSSRGRAEGAQSTLLPHQRREAQSSGLLRPWGRTSCRGQ